ncbi:MAG: hypothetical protein J0M04_00840 [Verrucomicrobia bacterium]|nr:hypothetical protein [Verrucomicrobiota bacterium]
MDADDTDLRAAAIMAEGVGLLENGMLVGALRCFDETIRLRERAPWDSSPHGAWLLAGAWLNRSDVLRRLDPPDHAGAEQALDMALERASRTVPGSDSRHVSRMALCFLNRASLRHETGRSDEALADFGSAENVLDQSPDRTAPSWQALKVMGGVNKALVLLDNNRVAEAHAALDACRDETDSLGEPDLTFRWHLAVCRAAGIMLDTEVGGNAPPISIETVVRAVRLASGLPIHRERIPELLAYGALLCRRCRPVGFAGFVNECLRIPGVLDHPRHRADLAGAVLLAIRDLELRVLHGWPGPDSGDDPVGLLRTLQYLHARLIDFP